MAHQHEDHARTHGGHGHHDGPDPSEFFDAQAREWDTDERRERARTITREVASIIPLSPDWDAVDVGCGTGLLSLELGPHLGRVLLTDVSAGMLQVAGEHTAADPERYRVEQRDLSTAPLPEPVDLAFSSMALHHVPDLDALLANIAASLRPGGWVALVDLDADPENTYHSDDFTGHLGIDRDELAAHLGRLGFADVSIRTIDTVIKEKNGEKFAHELFLATGHLPS